MVVLRCICQEGKNWEFNTPKCLIERQTVGVEQGVGERIAPSCLKNVQNPQ